MPETKKPIGYLHGYKLPEEVPQVLDDAYLVTPKAVLKEGTGDTFIDSSDKINLVDLTQSYAEQCGVEWMRKQMKLGLVDPNDVCDDGQHGGDATQLPADQFAADLLASKALQDKEALCEQLGLDPKKASENDIKAKVEEIYNKIQAAKPAKVEEAPKNE